MKKLIITLLVSVMLAGCGDSMVHAGKNYPTYGLFNEKTKKSSNMCYEIIPGNVVWSVILIETIIAPVYFVGFSMFEPVRPKTSPTDNCGID